MKTNLNIIFATALLGLVATTESLAGDSFVGAGLGNSNSRGDTSTAWKIFSGYQFTPEWGVEASYIDFGSPSSSDISGLGLSAVRSLSISDRFSAFGKMGLLRWDVKNTRNTGGVSTTANATGNNLFLGLGGQYEFSEEIGLRLEWEKFLSIGDSATDKSSADLLSVGFVYYF